jgi:DNA-binding MarR family transcriptional regulator
MMDQIVELLDEVRLLFNRAAQVVEELHHGERVTAGMRAVLEALDRAGSAPVPEIARRRQVSRQHIQVLVNALLAEELISTQDNPAHRRSPLVQLTPAGALMIRRMKKREQRYLARLEVAVGPGEFARARRTLENLREAMGVAHAEPEEPALPAVR